MSDGPGDRGSTRSEPQAEPDAATRPAVLDNAANLEQVDFEARALELAPIYRLASLVLTWGFRVAAILLAGGIGVALVRQEPLSSRAEPLPKVIDSLLDGQASGIVNMAILAMIATPVLTTLAVAIGFLRLGDRLYAALSLVVLTILGTSIAVALLS